MQHVYYITRKIDIRYSVVGKLLSKVQNDKLRSEGFLILSILVGIVVLIGIQYLSWAFFSDAILAEPLGRTAVTFWLVQVAGVVGFVLLTMAGVSPEYQIALSPTHIRISENGSGMVLDLAKINSVEIISSDTYQRYYRLFKKTHAFGRPIHDQVLLIRYNGDPFILCLSKSEIDKFFESVRVSLNRSSRAFELQQVSA